MLIAAILHNGLQLYRTSYAVRSAITVTTLTSELLVCTSLVLCCTTIIKDDASSYIKLSEHD